MREDGRSGTGFFHVSRGASVVGWWGIHSVLCIEGFIYSVSHGSHNIHNIIMY